MDKLIDFLLNNYIWFLVISLILVFSLIGYLVDLTSNPKKNKNEIKPLNTNEEEPKKVEVHPSVAVYTSDYFDKPLIDESNE